MNSELFVAREISLSPPVAPASFLQTQTDCIRKALAAAHNAAVVAVAAGSHNRSHGRWLGLIGWARDAQNDAATTALSDLYVFSGQVVWSLEHRTLDLIDPEVARQARAVLTARLDELSAAALSACDRLTVATSAAVVSG